MLVLYQLLKSHIISCAGGGVLQDAIAFDSDLVLQSERSTEVLVKMGQSLGLLA